jgi:hypothetical protein
LLKTIKFTWASSSIACPTIAGSAPGTITVSGCSGGDTGGGSKPLSAVALATGGTIDRLSGGSNTIGAPTLIPRSNKACPGFSKTATSNPTAEKFTASVTSDTGDGLKLPSIVFHRDTFKSDLVSRMVVFGDRESAAAR